MPHDVASPVVDLPSYPMLRADVPLLRRRVPELQIGTDGDAVVVVSAPPGLPRTLALLDGTHHLSELRRSARRSGIAAADLDALIGRLAAIGLLVGRPHRGTESPRPARLGLIGAGRLGRAIAELLVAQPLVDAATGLRLGELVLTDPAPMDPAIYPTLDSPVDAPAVGLSNAEALGRAIAAESRSGSGSPRVSVRQHAYGWPDRSPTLDLVVVCGDRWEADRPTMTELMRSDLPHLVAKATARGCVIGPLVLPGQTGCVRCTDLIRSDADPDWPRLLAQLSLLPTRAPAGMVGWAAGVACAQILAFLSGRIPETTGATIELSAVDFQTRRRSWQPHPQCGCRWALADPS